MTRYQGLSANQMAGRILHREDNTYKKEIIKRVLDMYAPNDSRVQEYLRNVIDEIKYTPQKQWR